MTKKRNLKVFFVVCVCFFLVLAVPHLASSKEPGKFITITAGGLSGTWYPASTAYAHVLGKNIKGHQFKVTTGGGVSNPKRVSMGEAELGVTTTDIAYAAYKGMKPFDKPQKIMALATLYRQPFQIAAVKGRGLKDAKDLCKARLVAGKPGTSGEAMCKKLLSLLGCDYDSIKAAGGEVHFTGYSDAAGLMRDNLADVHPVGSAIPTPYLEELNVSREMIILPMSDDLINKVLESTPGTFKMTIPKDTYRGMEADVKTFGNAICYVVSPDLPTDFVYQMTKILFENSAEIAAVSATLKKDLKLENALNGIKLPVHPGALKYYKEKGIQ